MNIYILNDKGCDLTQKTRCNTLDALGIKGDIMSLKEGKPMMNRDTDTISRQAVLDALNALQTYKMHEGSDELLIDRADIQKALEKLPPSPSRPHGHWIKHHESRAGIVYSCDRCGRTLQALSWETRKDVYKIYPFCHCGADMQC